MAEWLRRGLQSLVPRFEPGWRLQSTKHSRIGEAQVVELVDTRDLKSRSLIRSAGSIPALGTMKNFLHPYGWKRFFNEIHRVNLVAYFVNFAIRRATDSTNI